MALWLITPVWFWTFLLLKCQPKSVQSSVWGRRGFIWPILLPVVSSRLKTVSRHLEVKPCPSGPYWEWLCLCISCSAVILKVRECSKWAAIHWHHRMADSLKSLHGNVWLASALQICIAGVLRGAGKRVQIPLCLQPSRHVQGRACGIGGYFLSSLPLSYLALLSAGWSFHSLFVAYWS